MDYLYRSEVSLIASLQNYFKDYDECMLMMSNLGDPKNAFLLYFPISFFFHRSVGKKIIWVAAVCEWLNAILKWFLHGERPYWWVHERKDLQNLQQFRLTCETGPGSPSGHAMVTASVFFVMVSAVIHYKLQKSQFRMLGSVVLWSVFAGSMTMVMVSRCFIATHFPHQVLLGTLVGILVAVAFKNIPTRELMLKHYVLGSLFLLASIVLLYHVLQMLGFDPLWSIVKAEKWCANRDWVHLDTTLFYAIVRDSSILLGVGLGLHFSSNKIHDSTYSVKLLQIFLAITCTQFSDKMKIPHDHVAMFYILSFIKHTVLFYVISSLIPKLRWDSGKSKQS